MGLLGSGAEAEIELGVEGVAEEKFHDNLARLELGREAAQAGFVVVGGGAEGELGAKFLGETPFQTDDGLLADLVLLRQEAVGEAQFVLGEPLHADEEAALRALAARPLFDQAVNRFPAAQIEVADAEVGALGDLERVPQRWQEVEWRCCQRCGALWGGALAWWLEGSFRALLGAVARRGRQTGMMTSQLCRP